MIGGGEMMPNIGKKMERLGCMLTGLITLPIIGVLVFGPVGLVVGLIIGVIIAAGAMSKK